MSYISINAHINNLIIISLLMSFPMLYHINRRGVLVSANYIGCEGGCNY